MNGKNINKTTLPKKKEFYSNLNIKNNADADHMHARKVCKEVVTKDLGEYQDLYFKNNALCLTDVFKSVRTV